MSYSFRSPFAPEPPKPVGFVLDTAPTAAFAKELTEAYQSALNQSDFAFARGWGVIVDVDPKPSMLLPTDPSLSSVDQRRALRAHLQSVRQRLERRETDVNVVPVWDGPGFLPKGPPTRYIVSGRGETREYLSKPEALADARLRGGVLSVCDE